MNIGGKKNIFIILFCVNGILAAASLTQTTSPQGAGSGGDLSQYLQNLGSYLGYNLTNPPNQANVSENFLTPTDTQLYVNSLIYNFLGSIIPGTPLTIPSILTNSFSTNFFPNITFNGYSNPSGSSNAGAGSQNNTSMITISPLIDQPAPQTDPVNQAIYNILSTPDYTFCINNDPNSTPDPSAAYPCLFPTPLSQLSSSNLPSLPQAEASIALNSIGNYIPKPIEFFSSTYNSSIPPQLNINSLITPLMYNTGGASTSNYGLPAANQADIANNFIRHVIGAVTPLPLADYATYSNVYTQAGLSPLATNPTVTQLQSRASLAAYIASLRVYAAQISSAISNLYYILSKRLPQPNSNTSQALSEFYMATWRLYNSDLSQNTQWINQINQASAATVQKEIALLLAEINYQLYLNRQQDERLLLTNSIQVMQNSRQITPRLKPPS